MDLYSLWKTYVVVKEFETDAVNCIPSTWLVLESYDEDDDEDSNACERMVRYRLPSKAKLGKNFKFMKSDPPKKKWPVFSGKAILDTNLKEQAQAIVKRIKAQQIDNEELNFKTPRGRGQENLSNTSERRHSDAEEENPPGPSGTKKKKTEQENNHQNIQDESNENVNSLSATIDTEELHTHNFYTEFNTCNKFYNEFNTSFQNTMSILNNTADFLKKIISSHKDNVATKM